MNSSGNVVQGTGFGAGRTATGHYTVNFSSACADEPVVVATQVDHDDNVITVYNIQANSFQVRTKDVNGADAGDFQNREFTFIAMGRR